MDAAIIFKTISGKQSHPNQAAALALLGFEEVPTAPCHNAFNDDWYPLELLFRKAEQAVLQVKDPGGEDTIDWMGPTKEPPPTPELRPVPREVRLPTPPDFGKLGFNPSDQKPQGTQRYSSTSNAPVASQPSQRRKRRKGTRNKTPDTTGTTPLDTPIDNRPTKRPKMMETSQGDEPAAFERVSVAGPAPLDEEANNAIRSSQQGQTSGRETERRLLKEIEEMQRRFARGREGMAKEQICKPSSMT